MKTSGVKASIAAAALAVVFASMSEAEAALATSYTFSGKGNWSIDGIGGNGDPVGTVSAVVPTGSTVVKAFLYSSQYFTTGFTPSISLDGTTISAASWTQLGLLGGFLTAWRADVTAQMAAAVGGGSAAPFSFSVRELVGNVDNTNGEVLVIIYSNPAELTRTIALADGFATFAGDTTTITFGGPVNTGIAGFEALLSLGIGHGAGGSQFSIVDGNGRRLSSSAGGFNDGSLANGALLTVGGIGDSASNPDPSSTTAPDDELYNLALGNVVDGTPFLANGATSYTLRTSNSSNDDLIFFLGMNITAEASITTGVPLPPAVWGGLGMLSLLGLARHRRRAKPLS